MLQPWDGEFLVEIPRAQRDVYLANSGLMSLVPMKDDRATSYKLMEMSKVLTTIAHWEMLY